MSREFNIYLIIQLIIEHETHHLYILPLSYKRMMGFVVKPLGRWICKFANVITQKMRQCRRLKLIPWVQLLKVG